MEETETGGAMTEARWAGEEEAGESEICEAEAASDTRSPRETTCDGNTTEVRVTTCVYLT